GVPCVVEKSGTPRRAFPTEARHAGNTRAIDSTGRRGIFGARLSDGGRRSGIRQNSGILANSATYVTREFLSRCIFSTLTYVCVARNGADSLCFHAPGAQTRTAFA